MQNRRLRVRHSATRVLGYALIVVLVALTVYPFVAGAGLTQIALIVFALFVLLVSIFGSASVGHGLILLAFFTVPWNNVAKIGFLELSDVLFALGVLLLFQRFLSARLEIPNGFVVGAAPFVVLSLVSAAALGVGGDGWRHTLDVLLGVVIVPTLIAWWRPGNRLVTAAAIAYVLGTLVSIGYGLAHGSTVNNRYAGLASHPNVLGACSALSLALIAFLWHLSRTAFQRSCVGLAAASCLLGVWLSGSRAALVAVVVLAVLFPLIARSIVATYLVAAASIPVMVLVAKAAQAPSASDPLGRLLGGGDSAAATDARVTGTDQAFHLIVHHPVLGSGWVGVWEVHNIYLETAAAIGVFAVVCLFLMLSSLLRPMMSITGPHRWLAYPALAAALIGIVDPAIGARYIWEPIALALCAGRLHHEYLAARQQAAVEPEDHPTTEPAALQARIN